MAFFSHHNPTEAHFGALLASSKAPEPIKNHCFPYICSMCLLFDLFRLMLDFLELCPPILASFGPLLAPLGVLLGPPWGLLGASFAPLGAYLGPPWGLLGLPWALLALPCGLLGDLYLHLRRQLDLKLPSRAHLSPTWSHLGPNVALSRPLKPRKNLMFCFFL